MQNNATFCPSETFGNISQTKSTEVWRLSSFDAYPILSQKVPEMENRIKPNFRQFQGQVRVFFFFLGEKLYFVKVALPVENIFFSTKTSFPEVRGDSEQYELAQTKQ